MQRHIHIIRDVGVKKIFDSENVEVFRVERLVGLELVAHAVPHPILGEITLSKQTQNYYQIFIQIHMFTRVNMWYTRVNNMYTRGFHV